MSIAQFVQLEDEAFEHFYQLLDIRRLKRKEFLLREGEVCKEAYFVVQGLIRYFHVVDGEEITGQFFFEDAWYSDYESFLTGAPSEQYIQALEKTEVAALSKFNLNRLFQELPQFERFGRIMAEQAFIGLRRRMESYAHLNPEQRYLKLIKQRPKVVQRVPQHYIASYLGIKPQSLSRIRKRLLN